VSDEELKQLFEALRQENAAGHVETRQYVDRTAVETRQYIDEVNAETRRHFDVTAERLQSSIHLVAENVERVDQKLDRETAAIREEMRRGFADTQAMIKFSHAELDRRVRTLEDGHRTLEETVADLQARVERLESLPH